MVVYPLIRYISVYILLRLLRVRTTRSTSKLIILEYESTIDDDDDKDDDLIFPPKCVEKMKKADGRW